MDKWADYLISAVHYTPDHSHISDLKVHQDTGDSVGAGSSWTRSKVVLYIESGYSFMTIHLRNGSWTKGECVRVVEIDGTKYLRTDANRIKSDNLGELPEF